VREWRDAVWDAVPPDAEPERFGPRVAFLLSHVAAGDRVLDLGCGDGRFAAELLGVAGEVVAADVAAVALERAADRAPGAELVQLRDGAPLPFSGAAFDVVWAGETLEHVADVTELLTEVRRVVKPGGALLVTTPNLARLRIAAEALAGRPLEDRLDPRADHLRFFTARTLGAVLSAAGFADVQVRRVDGPPLLRRSLWAVAR
jgi:2-polyprenyl-3-methyl-5-hydroxy-6-metoxy-1,4-benzoquinol methylase